MFIINNIIGGLIQMIGTQKSQYSLLDGVFNGRTKKSRTDTLLKKINQFVDWKQLENLCKPMYKPSKKGKPSAPTLDYQNFSVIACYFL